MSDGPEVQPGTEQGGGGRRQAGAARSAPPLLALQRKLAQTQRAAALGALVGRLAHELGTPLHSIAGHLDLMLADADLTEKLRKRTEIIAGEVSRLSVMIRRYLRRLRTPGPLPTPTDVHAVLQGVLEVLEPLLRRQQIVLELDIEPGVEKPIACDRDQLEQVIVNLAQNAIDAMPRGGALVIRASSTGEGRAISFCDSGRGVPSEYMTYVFEPFFTTKEEGRGSGLGLAICREIARAHGGDIRLDSKPGEGTIVTVTLEPLLAPEDVP
jgi:signal transduction histidine kinase